MRTRLQTLLPSVLALTFATLLVVPTIALAQSTPEISMYPDNARPGSTVELTGTGFPSEHLVDLQLTTPESTTTLASTATDLEGGFRQIVALPLSAPEGTWELRATAVDGTTSTFGFTVVSETAAGDTGAEPAAAVVAEPVATEARAGNTSGDIALMLIIAVVLGGAAFGAMVIYRQIKDESPPGMGRGDDLIWGGGTPEGPEQTATEEPHWKTAQATEGAHSES